MVAILGISAFYHDSAAALIVDGEIVEAVQGDNMVEKPQYKGGSVYINPTQYFENVPKIA